jgi:hypothetical protein
VWVWVWVWAGFGPSGVSFSGAVGTSSHVPKFSALVDDLRPTAPHAAFQDTHSHCTRLVIE